MIYGHGGNRQALARRLGIDTDAVLDFSSNVNPLGPPEGLMAHLADRIGAITSLPEVDAAEAEAAFARSQGLSPDRVAADSGTTQFIYRLPSVLDIDSAVVVSPTYADYVDGCRRHGVAVRHHFCRSADGFRPDLDRLGSELTGREAVVICNPNNPTGLLIDGDALSAFCSRHSGTRFVVDESYLPFAQDGERHSMISRGLSNVLVLSSFSKIFRVPGLRIGFLVGPSEWIQRIRALRLPWSVNALALAAIHYIAQHNDETRRFIARTRDFLKAEKTLIDRALSPTGADIVCPSATSFVLVRLPAPWTSANAADALGREAMLIRDCSNFNGLTDRYIRFSLQQPAANRRLMDGFTRLLAGGRASAASAGGGYGA